MINVCDAVMGSYKTTAAVNFMNTHAVRRFIYITPYLDEAKRIHDACPSLQFVEPTPFNKSDRHTKRGHAARLIKEGRNVATTHQSFRTYTPDMLDDIRKGEYTLICDEVFDAMDEAEISPADLDLLEAAGLVATEDGVVTRTGVPYGQGVFTRMLDTLATRDMVVMDSVQGGQKKRLFFWLLPPDLIEAFADVYVLTYMFRGQNLRYMFDMYGLEYRYIGVRLNEDTGLHEFSTDWLEVPAYFSDIHQMIDICDDERLNEIGTPQRKNMRGRPENPLSIGWFDRNCSGQDSRCAKLSRNIYNYLHNRNGKTSLKEAMWCTFSDYERLVRPAGYGKHFLSFNARSTNAYRHKTCLAYACNVFMNVSAKTFFEKFSISPDEDAYALSVLIQWIWRSAIRDGKPVHIYIPSERMRNLLIAWMDEVSVLQSHAVSQRIYNHKEASDELA